MNAYEDVSFFPRHAKPLNSYRKYWAARFGTAPFLPMSREEMQQLGWDSCDVIIVTGDAYVDHPSFGMAVIGRMLENQGFRVGIIAQPDWQSADPFKALGKPNLFFGVTSGNMDSMINRYTADRKIRSDDAYTAGDIGGKRPDRAALVYSQRCKEAYSDVPIILGGIEGSLRRIAHYDYWSDKVRRSIVVDSKCDLLLYGNAERAIVEIAHRLASKEPVQNITDVRGTAFVRRQTPDGWFEIDSSSIDEPGRVEAHVNPYLMVSEVAKQQGQSCARDDEGQTVINLEGLRGKGKLKVPPRDKSVIRLPSYEQVKSDPVLYAHANRVLHLETNPGNARCLVQAHGEGATARDVWVNPPPIPLTTAEMDLVFDLPYARSPHPIYADANGSHDGDTKIPAWEMIRFSVNIMRGCFGGCTFCSITEHEGRIIQSRSEDSVIREIEDIRDKVSGFTGVISDLGGPTANMYRIGCKSPEIESACRKPSCVYPGICQNLNTNHSALIHMYRRARALKGVKKILIGSGLRYDLAVQSPEYVKELVTHHVGGYLKIAPEHTEGGPLSMMMKPGIGSYDKFKQMFDKYSAEAGKKQFLVPYFIAAHPGTSDADMMNLALWLKRNGFRADQVQTFYPSPMATATAMYHSGKNPLARVTRQSHAMDIVRGEKRRRLHKAFLRYHDANNWPLLREALKTMGRADLIGNGKHHLIPTFQPVTDGNYTSARRKNSTVVRSGRVLTQAHWSAAAQEKVITKRHISLQLSRNDKRFVWVLSIAQLITWGSVFYGFALFMVPLEKALDMTRAQSSLGFSLMLLTEGLLAFFIGRWIDRGHERFIMTVGSIAVGLILLAHSVITTMAQFYVVWTLLGIAMACTLYPPAFAVLTRRFPNHFRRAIIILSFLGGLASTVFIPLVAWLIDAIDWRQTMWVIAAMQLCICAPIHFYLLRDAPLNEAVTHSAENEHLSIWQFMRNPVFWQLSCFVVFLMAATSALPAHMVSLLRESGLSETWAIAVPASIGVLQVMGRLGLYLLEHRIDVHTSNRWVTVLIPLGLLALIIGHGEVMWCFIFVTLYGLGNGMLTIVKGTVMAEYVSKAHMGSLNGILGLPMALSRAAAPLLMGLMWSPSEGYIYGLWMLLVVSLLGVTALWSAQKNAQKI